MASLSRGAFSHGGHGAWYSPLPRGGEEGGVLGADSGGAAKSGARVVGVLRFSGCGDDDSFGDGLRAKALNWLSLAAGKHVFSLHRETGPKEPLVFRKLCPQTVLLADRPSGTTVDSVSVPSADLNWRSAHSRGVPPSTLRHSITRWVRSPATDDVGQARVTATRCPDMTALPAVGSVVLSRSPTGRCP
jgi:hypothetical protein